MKCFFHESKRVKLFYFFENFIVIILAQSRKTNCLFIAILPSFFYFSSFIRYFLPIKIKQHERMHLFLLFFLRICNEFFLAFLSIAPSKYKRIFTSHGYVIYFRKSFSVLLNIENVMVGVSINNSNKADDKERLVEANSGNVIVTVLVSFLL